VAVVVERMVEDMVSLVKLSTCMTSSRLSRT